MKSTLLKIACAVGFTIALASCDNGSEESKSFALSEDELIKRGAYLTTVGACHDCHSPKIMTPEGPMPDPSRLLSGHPQNEVNPVIPENREGWVMFNVNHFTSFVGPWGVSYAANLTPDDTGTGTWSFEQFKYAIRKGKYKGLEGSRDLLPPMPWQMYRNFTDDDLKAIYTYLRSIKPINNIVPAPIAPNDLIASK